MNLLAATRDDVVTHAAEVAARYRSVGLAFLMAVVVTLALTPIIIRIAHATGRFDEPDERRVHDAPTPRFGGVAMAIATIAASIVFVQWTQRGAVPGYLDQMRATLIGAACVTLVGLVDDIRGLRWGSKLVGQVGVSLVAVLGPLMSDRVHAVSQLTLVVRRVDLPILPAFVLPSIVGVVVSVLFIVAMMNVVNFIDGIDGLAAGTCAISAATFAVIAASYGRFNVAVLAAATCGAAMGFLPFNFRPGRALVFMGDSGSMLLGYLIGVIAIQGVLKTAVAVSLFIPLSLLAVPIFDTAFVVAKRIKHGQSIATPDRWHLHHRFLNLGYEPHVVTRWFWLWTLVMSSLALALRFVPYGHSGHLHLRGLLILSCFAAAALAVSIFLVVKLEIIKSRRVRERNAQIASRESGSPGS